MTAPTTLRARRRARLVTRRAVEFTRHGWPVAALAVPDVDSDCPCGAGCEGPHLVSKVVRTPDHAGQTWAAGHRWDVALVAADFDIVELPAGPGSELHRLLVTACPTMTVWRGRRWYFVVAADTVSATSVHAAGGTLHGGVDAWVAAPPTRLAPEGRRYWVVDPFHTRWRPYRRADAIDSVLDTTHAPQRHDAADRRQRDATEERR